MTFSHCKNTISLSQDCNGGGRLLIKGEVCALLGLIFIQESLIHSTLLKFKLQAWHNSNNGAKFQNSIDPCVGLLVVFKKTFTNLINCPRSRKLTLMLQMISWNITLKKRRKRKLVICRAQLELLPNIIKHARNQAQDVRTLISEKRTSSGS